MDLIWVWREGEYFLMGGWTADNQKSTDLPVRQSHDAPEAVGAVARGSGACNGWTFRHIEAKKGLRLINELRAEIRSGMAAG